MSRITMIRNAAEWWGAALIDDRSSPNPKQRFSQQLAETLREKTAPEYGAVFVFGAGEALHPILSAAMDGIEPDHILPRYNEDALLMFMDFEACEITVQNGYRAPPRRLELT